MWAKISWGSYWNWDPRETSITVLLLIYIAYFSLRSSLKNNPNRANISSVYLIFTMVTVPFFVFIIPRLYPSLHPNPVINPERKINMDPSMRVTLLIAVISFTMLYFYLLDIKNRISLIQSKLKEKEYEQ
jgi:heme exporter protein C